MSLQAHAMAVVALVLMVLAIGLLITLSSYHRFAAYSHDKPIFPLGGQAIDRLGVAAI
nr:hypothetical protein [Granulibacter bethesdensis]